MLKHTQCGAALFETCRFRLEFELPRVVTNYADVRFREAGRRFSLDFEVIFTLAFGLR